MREFTGENYTSTKWAQALCISEAKVGKSCFLVGSALGVLPWQKHGGIVDDPRNLHVITFDSSALGGVKRFLLETCGAPKEALNFHVYNMEQDLLDAAGTEEYCYTFLATLKETVQLINERAKGTAVLHVCSLTGVAEGLLNGIRSPSGEKPGAGMDMSKWSDFGLQISELRNLIHAGPWHSLWEAHLLRIERKKQRAEDNKVEETLQIPGKSGVNFPYNVSQIMRIRRQYGTKSPGTKCDLTYIDTQPSFEFISNGRNFNEALEPKEFDMAVAFHKLGLAVGRWGAKPAAPKPPGKQEAQKGK